MSIPILCGPFSDDMRKFSWQAFDCLLANLASCLFTKVGMAREGGRRVGGGPEGWGVKNFAFFPHPNRSFKCKFGVLVGGCVCVGGGRGRGEGGERGEG